MKDALDEYAVTFFTLLEHAYRNEASDYLMQISIANSPNMEPSDRSNLIRSLEQQQRDILDMTITDDYSGIEKLKKNL